MIIITIHPQPNFLFPVPYISVWNYCFTEVLLRGIGLPRLRLFPQRDVVLRQLGVGQIVDVSVNAQGIGLQHGAGKAADVQIPASDTARPTGSQPLKQGGSAREQADQAEMRPPQQRRVKQRLNAAPVAVT